ncbi:MAG TPA: 16S rRNA (adenine(1518)-N(6)/adenine(1519)-N(6))-dimethyltransferase RsmA [Myxococcota bacterium]|nr:16S rRNA (adenine(1518)-N(6)/adenine(1519)-N(6))-dimethyltransferase RsmA [Myxococcota bacterium]
MPLIPSAKTTIVEHGLKPKKSFGQNFMMEQNVNVMIKTAVASLGQASAVVEIGAGTGSLTHHLLSVSPKAHAVERDRDLIPILAERFKDEVARDHLIIHEADGVQFVLSSVMSADEPGVLVGNLPYHLTSSIILLALKNRSLLLGAVFLVQKEVADRLLAEPNNKQYGFLTVILNLGFSLSRVAVVNKAAFWPVPKVDSAIIKMTVSDHGISEVKDLDRFIVFVREIFQKRRKKLSTIFKGTLGAADFLALSIDADARPENLKPRQFLDLFLYFLCRTAA